MSPVLREVKDPGTGKVTGREYKEDSKPCGACSGTGFVVRFTANVPDRELVACGKCDGDGRV